jgi:hypothetical protein
MVIGALAVGAGVLPLLELVPLSLLLLQLIPDKTHAADNTAVPSMAAARPVNAVRFSRNMKTLLGR